MPPSHHPFFLACALFAGYGVFAVPASPEAGQRSLTITWNVLQNESVDRPGLFTSELILTNTGAQSLGSHGWQLYFNFSRKILPESVSETVRIVHVNGDLFRLEPHGNFIPLRPDASRTIRFQTGSAVFKASDAPSGFYIVTEDNIRRVKVAETLGDATVGPIHDPQLTMRAQQDQVAVPTPRSRYDENLDLIDSGNYPVAGIVPTPIFFKSIPGITEIDRDATIVASPQLRNEAAYLMEVLEPLIGCRPATQDQQVELSDSRVILLSVRDLTVGDRPRTTGDHAYHLSIRADKGIMITGTDRVGVFYGIQSLLAWLPVNAYRQPGEQLSVGAMEIEDAPRFHYRGLHLDVARNFQRPATVKKVLALMAFYKLNKFHFHLTDDEGWRLEIAGLPELTEIGGRRSHVANGLQTLPPSFGSGPQVDAAESYGSGSYSRKDFIDILRYAAARHIEVIPEIDLPGHSRAAIKAMEVRRQRLLAKGLEQEANEFLLSDPEDESEYESVQLWDDNVVNVCQESTYSFIRHVVADISSMYQEAGLKLSTIHLGGDEVPEGVWDSSPACRQEYYASQEGQPTIGQEAMADFFRKASDYCSVEHGVVTGAWEQVFLDDRRILPAAHGASSGRFSGTKYRCYAWNNVWGWGQEDAAYRLANAGVNVVLCNATHLYFDLAYNKDPQEPGYYWAGFIDTKTAFSFAPMNYLAKTRQDMLGRDIPRESINRLTRLTAAGKEHVLGIQGQLWGENLKGEAKLEYMALPRLIALAERAWSPEPEWVRDENVETWPLKFQQAWRGFANQLGVKELPRLDYLHGGFEYRIPQAGAVIEDGVLKANVTYPGLAIRYTTDGSEPDSNSQLYAEPVEVGATACVRVFASNGRGGRSCAVQEQ